jgi:hypothetical protein
MHDEERDRVVAMYTNRGRSGPREGQEGTSPADLLLEKGAQPAWRDRAGEGQQAVLTPPPPQPPAESDDPGGGPEFFDPESADYKAFGWAGNKTLPALIIILKDGTEYAINYCDLASAYPGGSMFLPSAPGFRGNVMRLRVAGDDGAFIIVIEGVRLRRVWELIMGHKTPWIHELPSGFAAVRDGEPVIRSINFIDRERLVGAGAAR